uniref:Histone domain-containing protein n=1 Tax=Rhabditophanes sp. KR3021 TaxID=114890 RepID=A0AC35TZ61_9BILA
METLCIPSSAKGSFSKLKRLITDERQSHDTVSNLIRVTEWFIRVVKSMIHESGERICMRITRDAMEVLHEAAEVYLVNMFEDANLLAVHSKRVIIMGRDITLWKKLKHQ